MIACPVCEEKFNLSFISLGEEGGRSWTKVICNSCGEYWTITDKAEDDMKENE